MYVHSTFMYACTYGRMDVFMYCSYVEKYVYACVYMWYYYIFG